MHKLKYLSLAQNDLINITSYIADTLKPPQTAMNLIDTLDHAISRLKQFPYSCKVYQPIKPLENEYRVLPVKNYLIFYVVSDTYVEIHRIIYAKMDITKTIR